MKKLSSFNFQLSTYEGFTLIELLVVIAIIGILSAILFVNFTNVRQKARDGERKSDLRQIQSALERYNADQGSYPTSGSLINCPTGSPTFFGNAPSCTTTYLSKIPTDPLPASYNNNGVYGYGTANSNMKYFLVACLENTNDSGYGTTGNPWAALDFSSAAASGALNGYSGCGNLFMLESP